MSYSLDFINEYIREAPQEFVTESDREFNERMERAADSICDNTTHSPVVLLSGPSGSGKTTTSKKLGEELGRRGIKTHVISLDNYFKTVDPKTAPRDENGDLDFESPDCLDMELLNEHFETLAKGGEIKVPYFWFSRQKRSASKFELVHLEDNELAVFEGIHALNKQITNVHPEAFTIYISISADVKEKGETLVTGPWMRLVRRIVRDNNFRGTSAEQTLAMWDNVMSGEEKYIKPFINRAKLTIDSGLPYELSVMKSVALPILQKVSPETENYEDLQQILHALEKFEELDEKYVAPESLLREFIGGGIYKY